MNRDFPPEDPVLCLQRDVYGFALEVRRENNVGHYPKNRNSMTIGSRGCQLELERIILDVLAIN